MPIKKIVLSKKCIHHGKLKPSQIAVKTQSRVNAAGKKIKYKTLICRLCALDHATKWKKNNMAKWESYQSKWRKKVAKNKKKRSK